MRKLAAIISKTLLFIFVGFIGLCIFLEIGHRKELYKKIQKEIKNENWSAAKIYLEDIGNYKDSKELLQITNYNFDLENGDRLYARKEYKLALEFYQNAKEIKDDEIIEQKIFETELKIQEIAKKQKLKQEELQQKRKKERNHTLANIEPTIKKTFYKVEFIENKELNARMYDFYINPYTWADLPYDAKEGAFKLAVLYAKLKTNEQYDNTDYLFSTKIRNANTKSVLAEYSAFGSIKIK